VSSFQLVPGVVVEPDRHQVFVMTPEGGIVGLDLASGEALWRSPEAAKPLTVVGDLLVGQAEQPGPDNTMRLVSLDVARGAPVAESLVELPPNVRPTIGQSAHRAFTAQAAPAGPQATRASVAWELVERPLRGVAGGPIQQLPGEAPPVVSAGASEGGPPPAFGAATAPAVAEPGGEATVLRGEVEIDPASGAVAPTVAPHLAVAPPGPVGLEAAAAAVPAEAPLPGVPQPQFLSADRRHVMSSQRVAGSDWDKYRWTIYRRDDGEELGSLRTFMRYAPFFVDGTRVLFLAPPHARRIGEELVEETLQIRATDLATGESLWSQPVRDTADREPRPP
jgi:hypothetical protein